MDTIGDRIGHIVAFSGLTKTEFGIALNLSQSMISKLCNNSAMPSERTISDICRIFTINAEWLKYGTGKMIDYQAREEELEDFFGVPLEDLPAARHIIQEFSKLNHEGQAKAVERVEELTEIPKYQKKPPQD